MTRAVLSAGSNIGDRLAELTAVVRGYAPYLVGVSQVYATAPWGGVAQDDFYNITLLVEGAHSPADWLGIGQELERAAERTREVRWGPRTVDVDVITVDDDSGPLRSDDPLLRLPHPRAAQRGFVLIPWLQIDPNATLWTPAGIRPVAELIADLDADEVAGVRALGALDELAGRVEQ